MSPRTRTRLSLSLLACLAAAGCGEQEDVSPNFEDRIPVGVEIEAADRVVTWGQDTRLTGTVTQGEEKLAAETVTLEADTFPFDNSFEALETIETDERGRFEIAVEPAANTSYRAVVGELSEAQSAPRRVYVEPRIELETEPVGSRTRFTTVFRHTKDRSIQGSDVYSYAAPAAEAEATGELRFIRVDEVRQVRVGLSEASIQLPLSEDDVRYSTCVGYAPSAGLGAPDDDCEQTEVPFDG